MKLIESKITWFCLRTGADRKTAIEFLQQSKNRVEVAIRLRNTQIKNKYYARKTDY